MTTTEPVQHVSVLMWRGAVPDAPGQEVDDATWAMLPADVRVALTRQGYGTPDPELWLTYVIRDEHEGLNLPIRTHGALINVINTTMATDPHDPMVLLADAAATAAVRRPPLHGYPLVAALPVVSSGAVAEFMIVVRVVPLPAHGRPEWINGWVATLGDARWRDGHRYDNLPGCLADAQLRAGMTSNALDLERLARRGTTAGGQEGYGPTNR